jgi:Domain of unknown function (DUF4159)
MSRLLSLLILIVPSVAFAKLEPEPLVDQVRSAIDRGVNYLRRQEQGRGHWELGGALALDKPGGATVLAMLALLNSGVPADDAMIKRGLEYVRAIELRYTYVIGLQTMVLAEAGDPRDRERIQQCVDWLVAARNMKGGSLTGWGYTNDGGQPDHSNSQYALLGLHAGRQVGAKIDIAVWESIRDYYQTSQSKVLRDAGGWPYQSDRGGQQSRLTMTIAGLCGMQIVSLELDKNRQGLRPDGTAEHCGVYVEDETIKRALAWLSATDLLGNPRFKFDHMYPYYNAYGIERAGRLTGQRFLAGHDWYREGCEYLVPKQQPDDSWHAVRGETLIFTPVINTSMALLFLSKGRTPVLISKWAYGSANGWNNKHFDAKNLVDFASVEMFKKQPLAWQVYDARKLNFRNIPERLREVGTLLQSPIVYMNGHEVPTMTVTQEQLLKQYIEEGGFVLAEACCGKAGFAGGFRDLIAKLFPDNPLRPLPPEHPIWRAWANVSPDFVPLEGIELGCKTVVVFSPQPLAGYWEEDLRKEGRGKEAFRLAGNVIAYATGMEPPKPRGTIADVSDDKADKKEPRGYLQVGQLRHGGDWQPAPKAMRNLMRHLREKEKLDVVLTTQEMTFTHPDLFKYKFLYLHGRGPFDVSNEGLENLRAVLNTGGVLLSDACCGSPGFDTAFRDFAAKLYPKSKLEPIPPDDVLYSEELNGAKIDKVKVRTGASGAGFDTAAPALEGIKVDGRWVVIYSRYDLGCALEKHTSGDCKGHDHESALKLAGAAVLYLLKK